MVLLRFIEDKKEWVQVDKSEKQKGDLYLDGGLKQKLDFAKEHISKDFDVGGIVSGDEGSGKSTLASNIMIYMSNNQFDPRTDIIKSHEDALKVLMNIPDGSAVMFDEGYLLFYSGDALTKHQKNITKIFSIIRQKNLFFLIVAPSFFRLATYFALDRTKFILRTYTKRGERGYFQYWGKKKKELLYRYGKPKHNYNAVRSKNIGRFSKCDLLDDAYKQIKKETLAEAFKEAEASKVKEPTPEELHREFRRKVIGNNPQFTLQQLADILRCSIATVKRDKVELRNEELNDKGKAPLLEVQSS